MMWVLALPADVVKVADCQCAGPFPAGSETALLPLATRLKLPMCLVGLGLSDLLEGVVHVAFVSSAL